MGFWMNQAAQYWLWDWIQPHHVGFEWGSGFSTVWLGRHSASLVSIENAIDWFRRIRELLEKSNVDTVELIYEPELPAYVATINRFPDGHFDYIFIDGFRKSRVICATHAWKKLKKGGILVFDDSEAKVYRDAVTFLNSKSDNVHHFSGRVENPWNDNVGWSQTSVWIK